MPSGYSSGEMLRMQQDAMARVREMQRRANQNLTPTDPAPPPPSTPSPQQEPPSAPPPQQEPSQTSKPSDKEPAFSLFSSLFGLDDNKESLFKKLGFEQEQVFLLVLLWLLWKEGADHKLLLALLYIML